MPARTHRLIHDGPLTLDTPAARFAIDAARLLRDDKCEHVVVLDVRRVSNVMEFVVIGSGTSDRQMNSSLDDVQIMGKDIDRVASRTSRDDRSTWLLADFGDVVVHLFEPNTRAYYDIEMLWGDAPRVSWRRPGTTAQAGDDEPGEMPEAGGEDDVDQAPDADETQNA